MATTRGGHRPDLTGTLIRSGGASQRQGEISFSGRLAVSSAKTPATTAPTDQCHAAQRHEGADDVAARVDHADDDRAEDQPQAVDRTTRAAATQEGWAAVRERASRCGTGGLRVSRAMQAFVAAGLVIGVAGYTATKVLNANTRPVHAPEPAPSDEPGDVRPTLPCDWTPTAASTDPVPRTIVVVACDPSLNQKGG
ncbi:hypothetical protein ACFU8W_39395 [Streptomyces sp. NPDC057565]|uniref:hypothetical protein n=1 Tax=Streptomyces sp. NPDC057565 TaxID=3346169 RepID=UPI0036B5016C